MHWNQENEMIKDKYGSMAFNQNYTNFSFSLPTKRAVNVCGVYIQYHLTLLELGF